MEFYFDVEHGILAETTGRAMDDALVVHTRARGAPALYWPGIPGLDDFARALERVYPPRRMSLVECLDQGRAAFDKVVEEGVIWRPQPFIKPPPSPEVSEELRSALPAYTMTAQELRNAVCPVGYVLASDTKPGPNWEPLMGQLYRGGSLPELTAALERVRPEWVSRAGVKLPHIPGSYIKVR